MRRSCAWQRARIGVLVTAAGVVTLGTHRSNCATGRPNVHKDAPLAEFERVAGRFPRFPDRAEVERLKSKRAEPGEVR